MHQKPNHRLTVKQSAFLDLIERCFRKTGQSPTIRELAQIRKDKSLRTVAQYLELLERKGAIRRERYKQRSIEVLRNDEEALTVSLPVMGAAGCGNPSICADQKYDEHLTIDRAFLKGRDTAKVVLIRAVGNSMVDAEVRDNDLIVTEVTTEVNQGDKVIAIIDGLAVLKKIHFTKNAVILKPMSPDPQYTPIIMTRNFRVFGKMVDVIKNIPTGELRYEPVSDN